MSGCTLCELYECADMQCLENSFLINLIDGIVAMGREALYYVDNQGWVWQSVPKILDINYVLMR